MLSVFKKLHINNGAYLSSYHYVSSVDAEIVALMDKFPWYFHINNGNGHHRLPIEEGILPWQLYLLHSCICMQRIRMYRPFLHPPTGNAAAICAKSAEDVLAVYRLLREKYGLDFKSSQKFRAHSYQPISAAVGLAALLLVEPSFPSDPIRKNIEMVIDDIDRTDTARTLILPFDGSKLLRMMLHIYDRRAWCDAREPERLAPAISSVLGDEQTTLRYLRRCKIGYLLNSDSSDAAHLAYPKHQPSAGVVAASANMVQEGSSSMSRSLPGHSLSISSSVAGLYGGHSSEMTIDEGPWTEAVPPGVSLDPNWDDETAALFDHILDNSQWDAFAPSLGFLS